MNRSVTKILGPRDTLKKGIRFLANKHKLSTNKQLGLRQLFLEYVVFEVRLLKLVCLETEDTFGHDELALDIFLDGEYEKSLKFTLKEGKSAAIGRKGLLKAEHKITLHLYDRDDLDADDLLGNITIVGTKDVSGWSKNRKRFDKDDAKYDLHYEVRPVFGFIPTALELVNAFAQRNSTPVWSKIDRITVTEQLEKRIIKPWIIAQGPTNFCGPSAVLFELARHMPKRYVKMVIDLYEKGRWQSANGAIKAPKDFLHEKIFSKVGRDPIPEVDWIALTSMRDTANVVFSLDETDDVDSNIQSMGLLYEIAAWCPQLLGWRNPDIYRTTQFASVGLKLEIFGITDFFFKVFTGDAFDGLKEAKKVMDKGGAVILQINTNLLKNLTELQISDEFVNNSNHFVSLFEYDNTMRLGNNGKVKMELYTWGKKRKIELSQALYEQELFSYIFTKPGAPI